MRLFPLPLLSPTSELLDDITDHWASLNHSEERQQFIQRMQAFAREHACRITLLSGDVHCCSMGLFRSRHRSRDIRRHGGDVNRALRDDPRYMLQVTSSAIANAGPPPAVVRGYHLLSRMYHLDRYTKERMLPLFKASARGHRRWFQKLMWRRNWCSVEEVVADGDGQPAVEGAPASDPHGIHPALLTASQEEGEADEKERERYRDQVEKEHGGYLRFQLHVEDKYDRIRPSLPYAFYVSPLDLPAKGTRPHQTAAKDRT